MAVLCKGPLSGSMTVRAPECAKRDVGGPGQSDADCDLSFPRLVKEEKTGQCPARLEELSLETTYCQGSFGLFVFREI